MLILDSVTVRPVPLADLNHSNRQLLRSNLIRVALLTCVFASGPKYAAFTQGVPWSEITQTAKPWTRWWWPGSAVDSANLTLQLEEMARVGFGGVEVTTIYGARGTEHRFIPYLSPEWNQHLSFAASEARRLGLGLDRAGISWRNFYDINLVNIEYQPFDATHWPLTPSGLLGPVRLVAQH